MSSLTKKKLKFIGYKRIIGFYLSLTLTELNEKLYGCSFVLFSKPFLNIIWTNTYWYDDKGEINNFCLEDGVLYLRKLAIGNPNDDQTKEG